MSFSDKSKNPGSKKSSSPKKNTSSAAKLEKSTRKDSKQTSSAKKSPEESGNLAEATTSGASLVQKLPEVAVAPTSPSAKSDRPHKSAGWKTSKLFSRTMSSIDVLRAFKKTAQQPNEDLAETRMSLKTHGSSSLKTKKTSVSGPNQDVMILVSTDEGGESQQSKMQFPSEAVKKNRSSSQDEGIVCKKEDLLFLIEASKRRPSQTSPTSSRTSSINEAQSFSFEEKPPASPTKVRSPKQGTSRASSSEKEAADQLDITNEGIVAQSPVAVTEPHGPEVTMEKDFEDGTKETEDCDTCTEEIVSKVHWDDGNFVDAMMIGDAIEAFLRGSLGSVASNEKRVSFENT